jgi:probable phosphoglycerate mutase
MPPTRRRIVVLRHGETVHNAAGIWQGQLDSELSELGLSPSRIVSSDLTRAARTARAVAEACGIPLTFDERFREIHAGTWQGMRNEVVAEQFPEERAAVSRGEDIKRGGHGESMSDVAARVRLALDELVEGMDPGECVVVSTHGTAGRAVAAVLLGLDQRLAWRILGAFGNCHWSELVEGEHGWRLVTWNTSAGTESREGSPPP